MLIGWQAQNLFSGRIVYGSYETTDFIAHGLGGDAGGGGLEINMTCSTNTGIERVTTGHKSTRHNARTSRTMKE